MRRQCLNIFPIRALRNEPMVPGGARAACESARTSRYQGSGNNVPVTHLLDGLPKLDPVPRFTLSG